MKLSILATSALALAPLALAKKHHKDHKGHKHHKENFDGATFASTSVSCATVPAYSNTAMTVTIISFETETTAVVTKTISTAATFTQDDRQTQVVTTTVEKNGHGTVKLRETKYKTKVHAARVYETTKAVAQTITPASSTTTVAAPAGFKPAAGSANQKRHLHGHGGGSANAGGSGDGNGAEGSAEVSAGATATYDDGAATSIAGQISSFAAGMTQSATLCTLFSEYTGTHTIHTTLDVLSVSPTITTLSGTTTQTFTLTMFNGGAVTETDTITKVVQSFTLTTFTMTVTPTVTAPAQVQEIFAACGAANQLNYTLDSLSSSGNSGSGLFQRDDGSMQGISNVTIAGGYTVQVADDSVLGAYECCAACYVMPDCAGTYVDSMGGCNLVMQSGGESCEMDNSMGTFFSNDDTLVGQGYIVSNGLCGMWTDGGEQGSSSSSGVGSL